MVYNKGNNIYDTAIMHITIKTTKRETFFYLAIVLLALVAIVLGYLIYQQQFSEESTSQESLTRSGIEQTPQKKSTDEIVEVLNIPPPDASQEEKQKHFELALREAKEASYLDITQCTLAAPVVFKVREGESFEVRNNDTEPHTIIINPENTFTIPAKESRDIAPDFVQGPGLYGYACDNVPRAVGMLFVEPKEQP